MIPFLDLKAQYESIKDEIMPAVSETLASTQWILGDQVTAFENEFAQYCSAGIGVGVNSGTSALHLALLAAGIGPGDKVITVANTFVATVAAIDYTGAQAVYVDVDEHTLNIDPGLIESAITTQTKAIVPVHLHGQPADMDPIMEIARRYGLVVIEDAAQAHGAEYRGRRVGTLADMGCFSFYPGKNLGACGEGGIVLTDNPLYAEKIRMLRDWGQERKYHHVHKGFNYRMEGLQAAILRVKLRHLDAWTTARRDIASYYDELLAGSDITCPWEQSNTRHVYHVYAIRVRDRDRVRQHLDKSHIQTGIHYPIPVHLQAAYATSRCVSGDLPVTERAAGELLSLPIFAELGKHEAMQVNNVLRSALKETA
ncbi:DegT/DnrJ/EryC1/StrS family aminotransferase [Parahaliea mediterranea]|uniref:DegT/DnrJ/EryC1/StrS family aminotransferase n=1 Tax=Parahaliea mediterranea TaxID=651086 RepID=A0A939DBK9_9GAMM|nr:DegT/DnrJ/EryC1/StrS family aminotransferase [Parahaliea mediterranea]MBN7795248.1 DegT/DnrJ/EryC1/StrS family aminotransferase [Parahaliea mediterranea]